MQKKTSLVNLQRFRNALAVLGLTASVGLAADITLTTDGMLPLGTPAKQGFRWFSYQVGPLAGGVGLTTQTENSEGALLGLFGGTTVGSNIANLTLAGPQGYFDLRGVINFNGAAGDIGSFTGDTPVPGLPGVTLGTDNIVAECLTYVEFPTAGTYTMGVNSDDGFRVTEGLARPRQAMIVDSPPAIAGPVGCSLPAALATAAGFGGPLPSTPLTAEVVLADPILAGTALVNAAAVSGKICVVDRGGGVAFALKAKNAQDAGAIAVIVVNQTFPTNMPIGMGGTDATVTIPALMIGKPDGDRIKAALAGGPVTMSLGALGGVELAGFNGGRGATDTTNTFTVPQAGLYPMRLVWYNGGGGVNVEWFMVDGSGGKHLLNNAADSASLRTFQGPLMTNWVAFNDHNPGAGTAPFVTPYDLWLGPGGALTNFTSGEAFAGENLLAQVSVSALGSPGAAGTMLAPNPGTPAAVLFGDKITMDNACYLLDSDDDRTIMTFSGLDPNMLYTLRTTSVRGRESDDAIRWAVAGIEGADSFTDFFTTNGTTADPKGAVPFDMHTFPSGTVTNGQIAWNSGRNQAAGDIFGWDNIAPGADGTFRVVTYRYMGPIPVAPGTAAGNPYGYGPECFMLEEVGLRTPVAVLAGPYGTNALQSLPFTVSVRAGGTVPRFQWYKEGVGAIAGANGPSFTVPVATLTDAGNYYVVVSNTFSAVTSSMAAVTVTVDNDPPGMVKASGAADLLSIYVEYSELMDPSSATDSINYTLTDAGGNPVDLAGTGTLLPGGKVVLLTTASPQTPATLYTITVTGDVTDLAGNRTVAPSNTAQFVSWVPMGAYAGLVFQYYSGMGGVNVADLTNSPNFPNNPTAVYRLTNGFNTREVFPDDTHDNYGGRIYGVFIPPSTGAWRFYIHSDDASVLYLNPSGPSPAGKVQIALETACCNGYTAPPSPRTSEAIPLTAGQAYYIEALYKEGGGGDYMQVAARLDGAGVPSTGTGTFLDAETIRGTWLGSPAIPAGVGGTIVVSQVPTNTTVDDNGVFTFSIAATSSSGYPLEYQWSRWDETSSSFTNIPNAIGTSFSGIGTLAEPSVRFKVTVILPGDIRGYEATLTVQSDLVPPVLLSARSDAAMDKIILSFNELMDPGTCQDPVNYSLSSGLAVTTATLAANGREVTLLLDAGSGLLQPDTLYTVTADVKDKAGNTAVAPGNTVEFRSWLFMGSYGGVVFEYFAGIGGSSVINLTTNAAFPNNPTAIYRLTNSLNSREIFPDDSHENYGVRAYGLFIPPYSGSWRFYLRSDDASELWLNPGGPSPAGKALLAQQTGCCNSYAAPPSALTSAAIPLTGGQAYYLEVMYKEGGGGDWMQVAARLDGEPVPADAESIPGAWLGWPYAPAGAGGVIVVSQAPTNATVDNSASYTFSIAATSTGYPRLQYQWSRWDGAAFTNIPNATGSSLSGFATPADNGARFKVTAILPGVFDSYEATLAVRADTIPPVLLSAAGDPSMGRIILSFSELMDPTTAQDPVNYSLSSGLAVSTATLGADGRTVTLFLDAGSGLLQPNTTYTVTADVKDTADNPTVAPDNTVSFRSFVFTPGLVKTEFYYNVLGSDITTVNDLLNHPGFPNSPDEVRYGASATWLPAANNYREYYGIRISGVFVPPVSGDYTFYTINDDSIRLQLSSGLNPANLVTIVDQPCCQGAYVDTKSGVAAGLVAGQQYYFEILGREVGGGDYWGVAVRVPGDLTATGNLSPMGGSLVGLYADPALATLTITQQPADQVFDPAGGGSIQPVLSETFNATNGGFTVDTPLATEGPWLYNAVTGTWREDGQSAENSHANTTKLNSPAYTMPASGHVKLTFVHRWSFEYDGTAWDGGQVRVSINGGPYATVPAVAFSAGGYNGTVYASGASDLKGQEGYISQSANYATAFITSVADLGFVNPGDTVSVQFMAAADTNTRGAVPNWEIDSFALDLSGTGTTVTFTAAAVGTLNGQPATITYQWEKDTGNGFVTIAGANGASYTLAPVLADNLTMFRVRVAVPGDAQISREALLTVVGGTGPAIRLDPAPSGSLTLSWPAAASTYVLEETTQFGATPAATVWTPSSEVPALVGSRKQVTVSTSGNHKFYRLKN